MHRKKEWSAEKSNSHCNGSFPRKKEIAKQLAEKGADVIVVDSSEGIFQTENNRLRKFLHSSNSIM